MNAFSYTVVMATCGITHVARAFADSRVSRIWAGTSEIMKLIIGRELLSD